MIPAHPVFHSRFDEKQVIHDLPGLFSFAIGRRVRWRCYCSIGIDVLHIMDASTTRHPYTSAARIVDGTLTYTKENSDDSQQLEISLLT